MIEIPQTVSINAWAAERDRLGLQVKGSIVNSGPDGLSVTLILDRQTTKGEPVSIKGLSDPEPEQPAVNGQKPKASLREIMAALIEAAKADQGIPKRHTLGHGLRIDVRAMGGKLYLQLSRDGKGPSDTEWATTMTHTPGAPKSLEYTTITNGGRVYMCASWPLE